MPRQRSRETWSLERLKEQRAWVIGGSLEWATTKAYASAFLSDRKSTRLNSSHLGISYAVFCLKKKKKTQTYKQVNSLRGLSIARIVCRTMYSRSLMARPSR